MLDLDRTSEPTPPGVGRLALLLHQLEESGEPVVLSINGKAEVAVADDGSLRMLANLVDRLELLESLRRGDRELDEGKGLSLEEVKAQARAKHGISL